jgi:four helix bundle protein
MKTKKTSNAESESGKTLNIERRTPNIEWSPRGVRISEQANSEYESNRKQKYDLEDRLLDFAVNIIELAEALPSTRAGNHIAGQLLRCGTSPYGNHGEVEAAESRKDFIHKLKICLKELRETKRWLRLVARLKKLGPPPDLTKCLSEVEQLIRIFVASVRTAEKYGK